MLQLEPPTLWPGPHVTVHDPEAADVPVMVPEYPELHVQLLPEVEPDGLLEYDGQVLHEEEPEELQEDLYLPDGQE